MYGNVVTIKFWLTFSALVLND